MGNPTFTRDAAEQLARSRGCQDKVMILGFRSATSKYGEYDDTLCLLTPDSYTEWLGNTLPSKFENGIACLQPGDYDWIRGLHGVHHFADIEATGGKALADEIQTFLEAHFAEPLDWPHEVLNAQGVAVPVPYPAFRQAGPMMIIRAGQFNIARPDGWPNAPAWIDGHCGGWHGTSSLACQTWYPDHWKDARAAIWKAMDQYGQKTITYSLHRI